MNQPDYYKIALLEIETWGRVFTPEAKKHGRVPASRWSDPEVNEAENNALMAAYGEGL